MAKPKRAAAAGRTLASVPVFEALAGAILRGKYAPGSTLPPERELSALFNVSRLIVRQALHRLREIGLLKGGQGGQSTVLDPDSSNDPRITALTMELAPEKTDRRDVIERQLLGGAILLELAELRILPDEVDELEAKLSDTQAQAEPDMAGFEAWFWTRVADATRNRILMREARWWFEMLTRQPERRKQMYDRLPLPIYGEIIRGLREGSGVARQFVQVVQPIFESRSSDDVGE
jgi:DNA-binding FadR family transcriptional regulator